MRFVFGEQELAKGTVNIYARSGKVALGVPIQQISDVLVGLCRSVDEYSKTVAAASDLPFCASIAELAHACGEYGVVKLGLCDVRDCRLECEKRVAGEVLGMLTSEAANKQCAVCNSAGRLWLFGRRL